MLAASPAGAASGPSARRCRSVRSRCRWGSCAPRPAWRPSHRRRRSLPEPGRRSPGRSPMPSQRAGVVAPKKPSSPSSRDDLRLDAAAFSRAAACGASRSCAEAADHVDDQRIGDGEKMIGHGAASLCKPSPLCTQCLCLYTWLDQSLRKRAKLPRPSDHHCITSNGRSPMIALSAVARHGERIFLRASHHGGKHPQGVGTAGIAHRAGVDFVSEHFGLAGDGLGSAMQRGARHGQLGLVGQQVPIGRNGRHPQDRAVLAGVGRNGAHRPSPCARLWLTEHYQNPERFASAA